MLERMIEDVYWSLQGELIEPVPGVENAFAPGKECAEKYSQMLDAYARICQRLGREDDDADVEVIINSLLRITKVLCFEMYRYGAKFENQRKNPYKAEKND